MSLHRPQVEGAKHFQPAPRHTSIQQPALPGKPAPQFHRHVPQAAAAGFQNTTEPEEEDATRSACVTPDTTIQSTSTKGSRSSPRSKSSRAFRSLAKSVVGMGRFVSVADDCLERNVDVQGVVSKIAMTLASPDTFKKVAGKMFEKFAEDVALPNGSQERQMPTACLQEVLDHWKIHEDHIGIFWAMIRKLESFWGSPVLPSHIGLKDFEHTLLKVLRRIRDRYCDHKVSRESAIRKNSQCLEQEYFTEHACGKGSFGECMFVTHRMSKTRRVCKTILKSEANVPSEEVEHELNTLRRLDHPNIVRVYEWFESDTAYLLVMEAAQGGDLKKYLAYFSQHHDEQDPKGARGLGEGLVRTLMKQALRALIYIHSQRVIHRDIKPANMLLASPPGETDHPRLLLADFGVAELFEDTGAKNSMKRGTVAYMAPEVFNDTVSPRSDIWALGVVTFEILCGERPIRGDNVMAIYNQVRKKTEISCEKLEVACISEAGIGFVKRCLTKNEATRPAAKEALEDPWFSCDLENKPFPVEPGRHARKLRNSLERYTSRSHFTKAAMNCIAAQLDTSRIEGLTAIFEAMDTDANGRLSPAEMACGLAKLDVDVDSIGQVVDALDVNCDGMITYSEFVAGLLQTQFQLVDDVLYHAFHIFDIDGDGSISLDELRHMLSGDGPLSSVLPDGKTVEEVLKEVDTSCDGLISFAEFRSYILVDGSKTAPSLSRKGSFVNDNADEVLLILEGDDILEAFRGLAPVLGRTEAELEAQAQRLKETHWINSVTDLRELSDHEWRRLNLPLKLERTLRQSITG